MTCAKCKKESPEGSKKCVGCGMTLVMPDEIDLMPEAVSDKPSGMPMFQQPAGDFQPSEPGGGGGGSGGPPGKGKRKSLEGRGASANVNSGGGKGILIGGALALLVVGGLGFALCGTKNEVKGKAKHEGPIAVPPGKSRVENFEVTGTIGYAFEVEALDGDVVIGVAKRSPKGLTTSAVLKALPGERRSIPAGRTDDLKGDLETGQYSWFLVNDGKKPIKTKVKFLAGPSD